MSLSRVQALLAENKAIKENIALFKGNSSYGDLKGEIVKFVEESKRNLNDMNNKIKGDNAKQNDHLHTLTSNYQSVLKKQIELLT